MLTDQEKEILNSLADAWNKWCELPSRGNDDDQEFMASIHAAQAQIALRVARRVDPDIWRQP